MKTATTDLLKNDLLIVELPEGAYYEVFKHGIYIKDDDGERGFIEGSYILRGSPDEISEEDAEELVEEITHSYSGGSNERKSFRYYNSKNTKKTAVVSTAKDSLLSAIETKIYWDVNPYGDEPTDRECICTDCKADNEDDERTWHEAESRTFDRKRTLIFKKN